MSAHHAVGNGDTREALRIAQRQTGVEARERRADQALRVVGIAETAQAARFVLHVAERARLRMGARVLGATFVVAAGLDIAAQVMQRDTLRGQVFRVHQRFRSCERIQRGLRVARQPMTRRNAQQGAAPVHRRVGRGKRCSCRLRRALAVADLLEQLRTHQLQRADVRGCARKRGAPVGQRERTVEPQRGVLLDGCATIGLRSLRRLASLQMLGAQRRIALAIPLGRLRVQRPASRVRDRRVDAIADERMAEEEVGAVWLHEMVGDQRVARVVRQAGQVPHERERKALADDRGRPQRDALTLRQAVHPRQHEAVHRGGQTVLVLVRRTQQLLEEQRIAACAGHALVHPLLRQRHEPAAEAPRVRIVERSKVDG